MAKRKSRLYKNRQSTMQLETLESRQLLATVTGGGTEVGSDISFQGNVYDQILLTGASVTVSADPGQVVRVSFLDLNGDIVQSEYSGSGNFSVSLDDFGAAAPPVNYDQPGVEYVSGTASFTIEGSDSSSNVSVFTVGPVTSPAFGLIDNGSDLDGVADIARITIVADPTQFGGSTFGGIRTANALFTDNSGIVGITASGVNVQSVVIVGDIDASDSGVPSLLFGAASQFGTLQVAGGDLAQSNGSAIANVTGAFSTANFIDGTTSDGVTLDAQDGSGTTWTAAAPTVTTLDVLETIDIDGLSQGAIDDIFLGKTFTNDLLITGDLPIQNNITTTEFRGSVTFDGVYDGPINVLNGIGDGLNFLAVEQDPDDIGAGDRDISSIISIGTAVGTITGVGADLAGDIRYGQASDTNTTYDDVNFTGSITAGSIGAGTLWVFGDFDGDLSTDVNSTTAGGFDDGFGEGAIGDINVTGDFTTGATVEGILGIGDIFIGGDLTATGTAFYTSSGAGGDSFLANVGTLTVDGDVDQGGGATLIDIAANGNFGDILISGGGSLGADDGTDNLEIGEIETNGTLGGSTTGSITIIEDSSDLELADGIDLTGGGTLGTVTLTGPGTNSSAVDLLFSANIGDGSGEIIGDVTASGFQTITMTDSIEGASVGNVSLSTTPGDATNASLIDIDGFITSGGDIGNIVLNAGSTNSTIDFDGEVTAAGDIGNIDFTAATVDLDGGFTSGGDIGNINIVGNLTFDSGSFEAYGNIGDITIDGDAIFDPNTGFHTETFQGDMGNVLITGDTIIDGSAPPNFEFANAGNFTFGGDTTFTGDGPVIRGHARTSSLDTIGDITFNGLVVGVTGVTDIRASSIGNISISATLAQGERLVTDLSVQAVNNGNAIVDNREIVNLDGSNLGDFTIGDISVTSTNTIGIADTFLFAGDSFFLGLGGIGDVTLSAGGSPAVQTGILENAVTADGVNFKVGSGNPNNTDRAAVDFDGDGTIGAITTPADTNVTAAIEADALYTGGAVSIGNITINTGAGSAAQGPDTINEGTGLLFLSGVDAPDGDTASDGVIDAMTTGAGAAGVEIINAPLLGTIGDVLVINSSQQLTSTGSASGLTLDTITTIGGIFANDGFGTIQGVDLGTALDATTEAVILGDDAAETVTEIGREEIFVLFV